MVKIIMASHRPNSIGTVISCRYIRSNGRRRDLRSNNCERHNQSHQSQLKIAGKLKLREFESNKEITVISSKNKHHQK